MEQNPGQPTAWRATRASALLCALAVLASFFVGLSRAPLFDVDEGAFSQATLEMFQRGDFLSTTLNGEPRHDKPILVYWLQAASVAALGPGELALRLPSALCATLWALLTFLFARRFFDTPRALLAAVMLSTSLGVYIIGRAATADALLNCLIAATMFAAWLHLHTGRRGWLYATHAAIGLGFLAKGPVAILIPFAVTLLFCLLRRDLRTWARAVFDWRGLALFALIALPWYAAILQREGWAFVEGFFFKHNLRRFGGTLQGHAGSLLYYFPILIAWTLPYTALLLPVAGRLKEVWRDDLQLYLLLWFAFVFVFFSLSGTKLPHYVLYGITGLMLLMAAHAPALRLRFWALLPALLLFVTLLLLPQLIALLLQPEVATALLPKVPDAYFRDALGEIGRYLGWELYLLCGAGLAIALGALWLRRVPVAAALVAAGGVATLPLSLVVGPAAGAVLQGPVKEAAQLCRDQGLEPIMWRLNAPSFSVYRGAPTPSREPRPGDVVITKAKRLAELPGYGYEVLYAKYGIVLVRVNAS
jgi:4-amino-4-deoxy-L-arabinose transferase-like glycosyltransferase